MKSLLPRTSLLLSLMLPTLAPAQSFQLRLQDPEAEIPVANGYGPGPYAQGEILTAMRDTSLPAGSPVVSDAQSGIRCYLSRWESAPDSFKSQALKRDGLVLPNSPENHGLTPPPSLPLNLRRGERFVLSAPSVHSSSQYADGVPVRTGSGWLLPEPTFGTEVVARLRGESTDELALTCSTWKKHSAEGSSVLGRQPMDQVLGQVFKIGAAR